MSLWDKPDLARLRGQVISAGFKAGGIRGSVFRCQCPAHQGNGYNAQFKMQPSGKITYTCYSHGCDLKLLMDAMDLVSSDFYPDDQNPLKRPPVGPDPSLDDWCLVTARDNRKNGISLTRNDLEREVEAFRRRRAGLPSPEVC